MKGQIMNHRLAYRKVNETTGKMMASLEAVAKWIPTTNAKG